MRKFAVTSHHAKYKIVQRTTLPDHVVKNLLDVNACVNLGEDPVFNKKYLLFYSKYDDDFFVAVQDSFIGTVITILPTNHNKTLPRAITENDRITAKSLWVYHKNNAGSTLPLIHVKYHYIDELETSKFVKICTINSFDYDGDINKYLKMVNIYDVVQAKLHELKIQIPSTKWAPYISVRLGSKGIPIILECS